MQHRKRRKVLILIQLNPYHEAHSGKFTTGGGGSGLAGGKKGGYAATGETNTEIGKVGEVIASRVLKAQDTPDAWIKAVGSNHYNTPIDKIQQGPSGPVGLEIKTITARSAGREAKLRMVPAARARKEAMAERFTGGRLKTVAVVVDTSSRKASVYQKDGIGNFRLSGMERINGEFDF